MSFNSVLNGLKIMFCIIKVAVSNALTMLGFYIPFLFLKNVAVEQGINLNYANLLISAIGVSSTIGK